ncbi:hypothetical protein [Haloarchaeobius salinus]|nr:hypothetical protein [Haloarchaeobius salinus]
MRVVGDRPDPSFQLYDNTDILDSHFDPELDVREVRIRLEPDVRAETE